MRLASGNLIPYTGACQVRTVSFLRMTTTTLHQSLNNALSHLLRPLARILLRNGISFAQFTEQAKRAYVDVAWNEFQIPGKVQTTSRIATLTGLTRKDVQRLNSGADDDPSTASAKYNRAARVISAWIDEPNYQGTDHQPLLLPFDGEVPSFSALVKAFSGDITPRTILDELVHVGAVREQEGGRLQLLARAYIPDGDDIEKIAILGNDTADLIATISHNLKAAPGQRYFQRKVCYNHLPRELIAELREIIERKAQAALESMNGDMALRDRDRHTELKGSGRVRAGLGIYYFEHEVKEDGQR